MCVCVCLCLSEDRRKMVSRQSRLIHSKDWITNVSVHKHRHTYTQCIIKLHWLYIPPNPNWHSSLEIWGSGLHFTTLWWEGTVCAPFTLSGLSGLPGAEQTGPLVSVKTVCKQTTREAAHAALQSSIYSIWFVLAQWIVCLDCSYKWTIKTIHLFESLCTATGQHLS